jgi:alpha-methylacyl-CoA racemase
MRSEVTGDVHGGPLSGLRVVEMDAIGPLLHAGLMLADLGADVVRVVRPVTAGADDGVDDANAAMLRGRTEIAVDLTSPGEARSLRGLIGGADVLMEGSRPGVMEKLGLGPDVVMEDNPGLVYGRMSGWGQDGPLARDPGHDINSLALTGALGQLGPASGPPTPPLNLVGNFGGGSMFLLVGLLSALHDRHRTGRGQVVDAAMVDGASSLTGLVRSWQHAGRWSTRRGTNLLDGSAPFYRAYECADGQFIAVGALEDVFYERFVRGIGLDPADLPNRWDSSNRETLTEIFGQRFASRGRDAWAEAFDGLDACVTPVLSLEEATRHDHAVRRGPSSTREGSRCPPQPLGWTRHTARRRGRHARIWTRHWRGGTSPVLSADRGPARGFVTGLDQGRSTFRVPSPTLTVRVRSRRTRRLWCHRASETSICRSEPWPRRKSRAASDSIRARAAPTQKWIPRPNDRCEPSARSGVNCSGWWKRRWSRLAVPQRRNRWVPAARAVPPSSVSLVTCR